MISTQKIIKIIKLINSKSYSKSGQRNSGQHCPCSAPGQGRAVGSQFFEDRGRAGQRADNFFENRGRAGQRAVSFQKTGAVPGQGRAALPYPAPNSVWTF